MKRFLGVVIVLLCAATLQAQEEEKDVTKFLGIPVDGYKPAMIEKLKAKGFTHSTWDKDALEGEFNGTDVLLSIVTNNNKVWRIALIDKNTQGETDIKIRFNRLCQQFRNNPKYTTLKTEEEQIIPDDENISYKIKINKKRYEASFYQNPQTDSLSLIRKTQFITEKAQSDLLHKYTQEQIDNPSEEIQSEILKLVAKYTIDMLTKKSVWFMIAERAGKYCICMYYDNEYNQADGEDL